jgi:hypothetical protein
MLSACVCVSTQLLRQSTSRILSMNVVTLDVAAISNNNMTDARICDMGVTLVPLNLKS